MKDIPRLKKTHPLFAQTKAFFGIWAKLPNVSFSQIGLVYEAAGEGKKHQWYKARLELNANANDGTHGKISWPIEISCEKTVIDGVDHFDNVLLDPVLGSIPLITTMVEGAEQVMELDASAASPFFLPTLLNKNKAIVDIMRKMGSAVLKQASLDIETSAVRPFLANVVTAPENEFGVDKLSLVVIYAKSNQCAQAALFDHLAWQVYNETELRDDWDEHQWEAAKKICIYNKLDFCGQLRGEFEEITYGGTVCFSADIKPVTDGFVEAAKLINAEIENHFTILTADGIMQSVPQFKHCAA